MIDSNSKKNKMENKVDIISEEKYNLTPSLVVIDLGCVLEFYETALSDTGNLFSPRRKVEKQFFKLTRRLTLECIRSSSNEQIGHEIKSMLNELDKRVLEYKKFKK